MEHSPETYARVVPRMRQALETAGRDPASITVTVVGSVGTPDELARWAELGVNRVIVTAWCKGENPLTGMERFATELIEPAGATWKPAVGA
jgi:alkanesulfonate monooxygenase SsuD/methylene tetrahydromethanopterin reductase-like flavin-dependent oxidoreductase (luciferase family)